MTPEQLKDDEWIAKRFSDIPAGLDDDDTVTITVASLRQAIVEIREEAMNKVSAAQREAIINNPEEL